MCGLQICQSSAVLRVTCCGILPVLCYRIPDGMVLLVLVWICSGNEVREDARLALGSSPFPVPE